MWILLIFIASGHGQNQIGAVEFTSLAKCEAAAKKIFSNNRTTYCVEK